MKMDQIISQILLFTLNQVLVRCKRKSGCTLKSTNLYLGGSFMEKTTTVKVVDALLDRLVSRANQRALIKAAAILNGDKIAEVWFVKHLNWKTQKELIQAVREEYSHEDRSEQD